MVQKKKKKQAGKTKSEHTFSDKRPLTQGSLHTTLFGSINGVEKSRRLTWKLSMTPLRCDDPFLCQKKIIVPYMINIQQFL